MDTSFLSSEQLQNISTLKVSHTQETLQQWALRVGARDVALVKIIGEPSYNDENYYTPELLLIVDKAFCMRHPGPLDKVLQRLANHIHSQDDCWASYPTTLEYADPVRLEKEGIAVLYAVPLEKQAVINTFYDRHIY